MNKCAGKTENKLNSAIQPSISNIDITEAQKSFSPLSLHLDINPRAISTISSDFVQSDDTYHGSTWSLGASSGTSASQIVRWYRHPKVREHWKVVVTSIVLFCLGLCLCIVGIVLEALNVELGGIFMFFVIGILLFIPGAYHMIAVYYAVKGKRGFRFYNLPLFN